MKKSAYESEQGDDILSCPDHDLDHDVDQDAETDKDDYAVGGLAVHGLDDLFITLDESFDQCHVLLVRTVEHIDDITDIEGNHA